jgi:heme-degrading monooxygenase HmoA
MFARVSTFKTGSDTTLNAPTDETVQRVLALPGCRGMYFLNDAENGKGLAITLWDSAESLAASQMAANTIRADASAEQGMEIVGVEEFEVTSVSLQD